MKVLFCIFSYATDLPLLRRNIDSIGRLKTLYPEHEILTAVVNDSNLPIADEDMPSVDIVKTTSWKRGFNLTDLENIFGQLGMYSELSEETSADVVIKMDSDTMMSRLDWLDVFTGDNAPSIFGTCIYKTLNHICGYFYGMKPDVIAAMKQLSEDESIAARIMATREGWILEDRIYTRLGQMAHARRLCGAVRMERLDLKEYAQQFLSDTEQRAPMSGTQWIKEHGVPIDRYKNAIAVTFKRRGKTDDIVAEALEGMTAFWEVLKDAPRFKTAEETRTAQEAARRTEAETAVPAE